MTDANAPTGDLNLMDEQSLTIDMDSLPDQVEIVDQGFHRFMIDDVKLDDPREAGEPPTLKVRMHIDNSEDIQNGTTQFDNITWEPTKKTRDMVKYKQLMIASFGALTGSQRINLRDFFGKIVYATITHSQGKKDPTKTYANVKEYLLKIPEGMSTGSAVDL